MRFAISSAVLCLSVALGACQKKENKEQPDEHRVVVFDKPAETSKTEKPEKPKPGETSQKPDQATEFMNAFRVECENPTSCNPSVGLLIAKLTVGGAAGVGVCTATMVGEDLAITNKHCLPESLMNSGASCASAMIMRFPKSKGYEEVSVPCLSVLEVSPYDVTLNPPRQQTDYAFLRLAVSPKRPVVRFDPRGIDDGETVRVTRMSPFFSARKGVISDLKCRAAQRTIVTPVYTSRFSPVVHLNDCPIVSGNSGSSIFGADGRIKGLVQQGPSGESKLKKAFARGTNIACVRSAAGGLSGNSDPACSQDLSDRGIEIATNKLVEEELRLKEQFTLIESRLKHLAAQAPVIFEWQPRYDSPNPEQKARQVLMTAVMEPKCISKFDASSSSSWISTYRQPKSVDQFQSQALAEMSLMLWEVRLVIDENLRFHSATDEKVFAGHVVFLPQVIAAHKTDRPWLRHKTGETFHVPAQAIKLCP